MFNREGFRSFYFKSIGSSQNAFNTYASYLKRIDEAVGGLDEKYEQDGADGLRNLAGTYEGEPFLSHRSQSRSILGAYLAFKELAGVEDAESDDVSPEEAILSVFKYENELQSAVRLQLDNLEPGLTEVDNGIESVFETGKSDILARDANGVAVVIELKAGRCPKGAMEQVLGYASDWRATGEPKVRAMLVAGEFTTRQMAASKLIPSLELKIYSLAVKFDDAT